MADHPARLLITGASRGIGEATARLCAQWGHRMALLARSVAAIESLAYEIDGLATRCDVADEAAVRRAIHKSATEFGGIGVVINNVGTLTPLAMVGLTVIAASETEHLTLWIWQAAFRSDTPKPVRQLPVLLPGLLWPRILVGGAVL